MKSKFLPLLATLVFLAPFLSRAADAPAAAADPESPTAKEKRLAWFRHDKFGLFIHWGLYAIPAGYWKGARAPGIGEWVMNRMKIPVAEYSQLAAQFNPVQFDAEAWAQLAEDAGMKYVVITSKHHDGFALFKSAVSPYNAVDATPFKRDIIKELAAACAKHGLRFGVYYSQSQDWHERGGTGNNWDFPENAVKDKDGSYDQYLREKVEPQLRELLTNYGPMCLIWFDTPQLMTGDRPKRLTDIVRTLQPDTLIDGRLGAVGDYQSTGDNVIPAKANDDAFEVPATLNQTWGFRTDDHNWKSPGEVVFKLVDIVSKGGNYLLNVGPMANGVIPQPSQDNLRAVGAWLRMNGEAVYGTGRSPFGEEFGDYAATQKTTDGKPLFLARTDWRCTTKPGRLYFTLFRIGREGFMLPAFKNAIKSATQIDETGRRVPLQVQTGADGIRKLDVPRAAVLDTMGAVVVVEFEGGKVER
ncbi:MAG: alpha-L-fucosidase [bacterium]|nr:alpha-L-fucosidase [bacterium]MDI1337013.1 alpha-L-fucosidase [Lacunisphaera sp.]